MPRLLLPLGLLLLISCTSTLPRETDRLLRRYEMYGFTGSVLVAEHGRAGLERSYGIRERAFDAGSIMKTVVAAAMLQLQSEHRLSVTDPIGRYLSSLRPERASITIEQLLLHTSGLPLDVVGGDLLATVATAPLVAKPGERYSYSNVGYGALALIVERVSGEPFAAFARRNFLGPAGMTETSFWGEPALPMPRSYSGNSDEELEPVAPLVHGSRMAGKYVFGAAGLITTTRDLLRWWRFVSQRPEAFTERIEGQAYGWNIRPDKIYRGGFIQGSVMSMLSAYRRRDAVLIWMMNKNTGWHEPLTKNFERILAGEAYLLPPAVIRGRDDVAATYAGAQGRVSITRDHDDLLVAAEGQKLLSLLWRLDDASAANTKARESQPTCEVLGTARHPSSSERLQTFVRCGGDVSRLISEGGAFLAKAPGYPRAAQRRFRRIGRNKYALYDPKVDFVVTLEIVGKSLVLRSDSGKDDLRLIDTE